MSVVRALLDAGASVDARRSIEAATGLHHAADAGSLEQVEQLLAAGAEADIP